MNRDDLEDARIRAALQRDLERLDAGLVDDPAAAVATRVRARRRRRRAVVASTVVIGLFAVAATTATVINDEPAKVKTVSPTEEQQQTIPAPPDPTPGDRSSSQNPLLPLTEGITYLEEPPLRPRWGPAMVWTGSEIVAWGGQASDGSGRTFTDGAAYDVDTRRWRPMADAPLPGGESPPVGAMTGAGVVIAQGTTVARWEPATNIWHELPGPPRPVVDLATDGTLAVSASANAVLDTRNGRWRELPEPPVHLERPTTAWTGSELVVVGGPSTAFTSAVALAVDPSEGVWRRLAALPDRLHAEALSADWDGERVVVVNYDMQAVAFDPRSDQWEQLPDTPARFYENAPTFVSPGNGTGVAFHALAAVVRTAGDLWVPLPNDLLPQGRVISLRDGQARGLLLVWTVDGSDRNRPYALDPVDFVKSASAVQVGIARIDVAARTLVESRYGSDDDTVEVVAEPTPGVRCTIASGYGRPLDNRTLPVTEELDDGQGTRTEWRRDRAGAKWQAGASTTDTVTISCDDADVARDLATSARFP